MGIIEISGIIDTSLAFSAGKKIYFFAEFLAKITAGKIPFTARRLPSKASSPRKIDSSRIFPSKEISLARIPSAIGKS